MNKVIIHEAHVQGDERSGYRPTCRCGWAGATGYWLDEQLAPVNAAKGRS